MKELFKSSLQQLIPILLAAIAAAFLTFIQTLISHATAGAVPTGNIAETGFYGASFKAAHQFIKGSIVPTA